MVEKINSLGQKIYNLNKGIVKVEAEGVERANDLRDSRDLALDELSKYIDIDYYETKDGEVIVSAENVPFITKNRYRKDERKRRRNIWTAYTSVGGISAGCI